MERRGREPVWRNLTAACFSACWFGENTLSFLHLIRFFFSAALIFFLSFASSPNMCNRYKTNNKRRFAARSSPFEEATRVLNQGPLSPQDAAKGVQITCCYERQQQCRSIVVNGFRIPCLVVSVVGSGTLLFLS